MTGREWPMVAFVRAYVSKHIPEAEIRMDKLGNLYITKGESDKEKTTWLVLEHTPAGLAVTLLDAELNCAIQMNGLTLNVEKVEGNVINYTINLDPLADCNCLIERVSSTVDGLQEGKEYVLNYAISYWLPLKPIKFRYHSGLKKYVDVRKNVDESRIISGSE